MKLIVLVLLAVPLALPAFAGEPVPTPLVTVRNVGLAVPFREQARIVGQLAFFRVPEADQGTDLNGDADLTDSVLHVLDLGTGQVTNLGLPAAPLLPGDELFVESAGAIALEVEEARQGALDLNGDGDATDTVLHVFRPATGTVTNLQLAVDRGGTRVGDAVAFVVPEPDQGGLDRNGDSDALDSVVHVYDPVTDSVTNLSLAVRQPVFSGTMQIDGPRLAFNVSEADQGNTDLNGDTDASDQILHAVLTDTGEIRNLGLPGSALRVGSEAAVFFVGEGLVGDLNGDGDMFDLIVHVHDYARNRTGDIGLPMDQSTYALEGNLFAFVVREQAQGNTDLNGDGDAIDDVLHVLNTTTGTTTNLGVGVWTFDTDSLEVRPPRVAFAVQEFQQGQDLNGDGDTGGLEFVAHVYDDASGELRNLGLAIQDPNQPPSIIGDLIVTPVRETAQGNRVRNGDGDLGDSPLHVWDDFRKQGRNTRLAPPIDTGFGGDAFHAFGYQGSRDNTLAFLVDERAQRDGSLNGDGDTDDRVLHIYDSTTRASTNLGLAADYQSPVMGRDVVVFAVPESDAGEDLNADLDQDDVVLHTVELRPCNRGTVNTGAGAAQEVLRVNGEGERITLSVGEPLTLDFDAAAQGPLAGRFVFWVWNRFPENATLLRAAGQTLGCFGNPTPLTLSASPQPLKCVLGAGLPSRLCRDVQQVPGPATLPFSLPVPGGVTFPTELTIQGLAEDAGAANGLGFSVTNAVLLKVVP